MQRTLLHRLAPLAIAIAALNITGCSDTLSGPAPEAPHAASFQRDVSTKGHRHKDHTLKQKDGSRELYLDDAAQVLHDNAGNERALPHDIYAKLARDFDRITRADARYEQLDTDASFQSCVKNAKKNGSKVRLARGPAHASGPFARGGARLSLAPTGTALLDESYNPTYCQEASMGLYDATAQYWDARKAYLTAVAASFLSGFCVQCEAITYDPTGPLALAGAAAVEYAAANYANALTMVGIWGTFFNLGGCGQVGAQYGYFTDPADNLSCEIEHITIEVSYDNGLTWSTWWSGDATVCHG